MQTWKFAMVFEAYATAVQKIATSNHSQLCNSNFAFSCNWMQIFTQLQNQIKLITYFASRRKGETYFLSETAPQKSLNSNQFQSLFKLWLK